MKIPEISVIIPIYNAECYLRDSLNSLLLQTCEDWEAICINDGSAVHQRRFCRNMPPKIIVL